ncbi:MAG TPA: hypothetical protein VKG83_20890, partial [Mycobacterium sp.]|nr:hypothetical protein [Mycobacterium sp.]
MCDIFDIACKPAGNARKGANYHLKVFRQLKGSAPLLGAIVLIGLGGLFAAIDAALSTVSMARVAELVRDQRPGA